MRTRTLVVVCLAVLLAGSTFAAAQTSRPTYQKPPKVVSDVLESPPTPAVSVSPARDRFLEVEGLRHPPIADLAAPMLRIAGLRINPATNGRHHPARVVGLTLVNIADGKTTKLKTPPNAYLSAPIWAADGKHFAFTNTVADGIDLWLGDASSGLVKHFPGVRINAVYGEAVQWMPDQKTLLVQLVPARRGKVPEEPRVPLGPNVQENEGGKPAPAATYEDMLRNPHDEDLFDYYATAQLAYVDIATAKVTPVGAPAIYQMIDPSPDARHILVARLHKPYSYLLPAFNFPKKVEVWDRAGKVEHTLADLPLEEHVPIEGVPTGPRAYQWRPTAKATLAWAEALDGGDTKAKVPFRDKVLTLAAPFSGQPAELIKLEQRFTGGRGFGGGGALMWGDKFAFVSDYDRNKRWARTFMIDPDNPSQPPRQVWSRSIQDRYGDPGQPVMRERADGTRVIWQTGNAIFLRGEGASAGGDHPFLNKMDLTSLKSERIFQSDEKVYEQPLALVSDDGSKFITRFETPTDPPNYFLRTAGSSDRKALTSFPDPAPQLKGITKQLVTYKRADGVGLSFTLYLPADYKQGTRLPTVVWAYPLEFNDAGTASQVTGSPYRFTTFGGLSHLFLLTQGYAVLDGATMPVVGDPETMNETYVEQIVASAKAAIDKAVEMGVTDRNRVGVGGHSYGAFMTANLLAHSDLFKAGVARSGAYNRTLTPFGFQSERRNFFDAQQTYLDMSPFYRADKISGPLLMYHSLEDQNVGTAPISSIRMFHALQGLGKPAALFLYPYEDHSVATYQTDLDQWARWFAWFDMYVKNPKTETKTQP